MDRIVLELRDKEEWQRCVACGYEAQRPALSRAGAGAPPGIPRGKPERRRPSEQDASTQTVKIMDLQPELKPPDEPK